MSGGSFFSGHANQFRVDRLGLFQRLHREHTDIAAFRVFQQPVVWLNSLELVHELLVTNVRSLAKSPGARFMFYPLTGEGLLTTDGERWRRQRRLVAPFFAPSYIGEYLTAVRAVMIRWIDDLRDDQEIDVTREMTRVAMTVVSRALFGADTYHDADELGDAVTTFLDITSQGSGSLSVMAKMVLFAAIDGLQGRGPGWMDSALASLLEHLAYPPPLPTERDRRLRHALAVLSEHVQRMIAERKATGLTREDILTKLLLARDEDGNTMSDKQVRDEVLTLFFAGHETTAMALSWTLYQLSCYEEVYQRQLQEVDTLGGASPTLEDLARLPYTLAVFKETLRLKPPVYIFDRVAREAVTLGGYAVPAGTVFFVCPYTLHRRPDLWPDPERFDPERFLPAGEAKRSRLAFLAFGAGPRICVGNHLAQMEGHLFLTLLAQRVQFSLVPGQTVVPNAVTTLRAPSPLLLRVHLRDRREEPADRRGNQVDVTRRGGAPSDRSCDSDPAATA
ncbi:MAG: cytochrome P450 [Byssovorax sp.]